MPVEIVELFRHFQIFALSMATFVGLSISFIVIKKLLWGRIEKLLHDFEIHTDHPILSRLHRSINLLLLLAAFALALQVAPSPFRKQVAILLCLKTLVILFVMRLSLHLVNLILHTAKPFRNLDPNTRSLTQKLTQLLLVSVTLLILLDTFGISITPVLASLGVGSLAVALALQDTLSNFFSGIYILIDKPIRPGDAIQVEQLQGKVVRIGWRSTHILSGNQSTIVIPNSKLSSSVVTNYNIPSAEVNFTVEVPLASNTDVQKAEAIFMAVSKRLFPGLPPLIRIQSVQEGRIIFSATLKAVNFDATGLTRHQFLTALLPELSAQGIALAHAKFL